MHARVICPQAKEAVRDGRELQGIKDARLNIGQDDARDMESILRVAVLCVSEAQEGRPTMEVVFDVVDEVWRKTRGRHLAPPSERSLQGACRRPLVPRVSVGADRSS